MSTSRFEERAERPQPWGPGPGEEPEESRRPREREPMFNAPWPAVLLLAVIVGGYAVQSRFPAEATAGLWGYSPEAVAEGRWVTLVTALFLHGNWPHALMNAAFALAFATPVARYFGARPLGVASFFAFYLASGVLANLAFGAMHPASNALLVGASGAVSGLMGGASRLMAGQGWRLGPILSRPVLGMGGAWLAINLLIGLIGSQLIPGAGGAGIAWEAHVAGFVAGVFLVGPFAWIARR